MKRSVFLKGVAAAALAPALARAQGAYPEKQIRMVIPFSPGGTTDLLARAVGQHLQEAWGQVVVADNRAGANGVVAGDIVAKAPGDGYTLSTVAMGHAINPLIYKKLPYDGVNDFTPISLLATFPQLVLVHPSLPVKTLAELIDLARKSPKPLNYGSGGNGSSQHLAGALFAHMAGLTMTHVAYKGGNPAQLDLMAGNLDLVIIQPNSREVVTSGKLRALAVSSPQRSPDYPDVPTVSEAGVPGYQSVAWYGLVGPKNMPDAVLKKLSEETIRAVAAPGVRAVIATSGGVAVGGTPAEFADFIAAERKRYETIVREAGMTVD
ncbi:Bug family tripartite tricarboxylate transporter substrate binding protein [Reyranella sp.]|uniref:Bug family tripartite tricarboxylate transporter substrate binding protein n=1 Tax=Reyranella sp. TaxID=1929291 RepID=UPI003D0DD92C